MAGLVHAKPSLANYDIHINFRGGRHLAGLIYETLIYGKEQYERRNFHELNRRLGVLPFCFPNFSVQAQDLLPACPRRTRYESLQADANRGCWEILFL